MKIDSEQIRGELFYLADTLGEEGGDVNNAIDYIKKLESELKSRMYQCKKSFTTLNGANFIKNEWYHFFDDDGITVIIDDNNKTIADDGSIIFDDYFYDKFIVRRGDE